MTDTPKISIIMPSRNKYPLNVFSLNALEQQTFNLSEVEVLFIDDASQDATQSLQYNYSPPFQFHYIRLNENLGRSKARNLALRRAKGELLLFLDAEILVEPNWLANRWRLHQQSEKLIVSGVMVLKGLYTAMFPGFDRDQMKQANSLAGNNPMFTKRLKSFQTNPKQTTPLITKEDIRQRSYHSLAFEKPYMQQQVLQYYGDHFTGFYLPWLAFLTGNVSVKKSFLEETGLFDEGFHGYGWEDQEMGYRLYKNGATIINTRADISYHQEHPVSTKNHKDATRNFVYMQQKHPETGMLVLSLIHLPGGKSLKEVNEVFTNFRKLCLIHPNRYLAFKEGFRVMLLSISQCLLENKPVRKLASTMNREQHANMTNELNLIKGTGNYPNLVHTANQMLQL